MEMLRDYRPPADWAEQELTPLTRKKALKAYSKGDLIRYILELEARIEQTQPQPKG